MGKLALVLGVAAAACLLAAGSAVSDPVFAGQCGIRAQQTVWGEYGWPSLLPILARPGTLLAATTRSGTDYAVAARKRGAATYAFDLKMSNKVGTPTAPADPSTLEAAAEDGVSAGRRAQRGLRDAARRRERALRREDPDPVERIDRAVPRERARLPAGSRRAGRASGSADQQVAVRRLRRRGRVVASVAKVSDIVREVYLPATKIWPLGPILGNRLLRQSYRNAVTDLSTSLGIPATRLGIMISFLSQKGVGGRNGLEPGLGLVPGRQVGGALREAGREGGRAGLGLLLGLAGVEQEGDGSRQAEGGLRLALGTDAAPLQRASDAREELRPVADRRTDRSAARRRSVASPASAPSTAVASARSRR